MPTALILVSVLLQALADGFLSGRLGFGGSLQFSCIAFVTATVACGALHAVRSRRTTRRPTPRGRGTVRLMALMNLATAVTFLGFYVSLAWVPAALASSVQSGVGPLAVICTGLVRGEGRPGPGRVAAALGLLVLSGAIALRLDGRAGTLDGAALGGTALVALSGVSAALLARLSRQLGQAGAEPTWVMTHRFHLTYVCAGALLFLGAGGTASAGPALPLMALTALGAVALPLLLLQIGLQRAEPLSAMVLLSTLPGLVYLSQSLFGGTLDAVTCALIALLIAVAVLAARPERRAAPPVDVKTPEPASLTSAPPV
ncbi:hypothetical protein AV521_23410 [Streptomyces sp. IMTB 2501]|uniref:hypothetical protein n=1 Tax=Streptomyces sp. IMTB 2501 TaxID=1776340 RepID=UPI00096E23E8|nr:hypothetical protein [Streptomyces sp. IMTB 2501]OLZ67831.1 hypothetical protein AV521_23410 [Streptomyces sp. IMTB 2501]